MRTVTVHLVGLSAPGQPRRVLVELGEPATLRALVEAVARQGGEVLRASLWLGEGRLGPSVVIAVDGEVVDPDHLDRPLPGGRAAEVFLIHPIVGGAPARGRRRGPPSALVDQWVQERP